MRFECEDSSKQILILSIFGLLGVILYFLKLFEIQGLSIAVGSVVFIMYLRYIDNSVGSIDFLLEDAGLVVINKGVEILVEWGSILKMVDNIDGLSFLLCDGTNFTIDNKIKNYEAFRILLRKKLTSNDIKMVFGGELVVK